MFEYLIKEDIILINQKTVSKHGGNFVPPSNFLHEDSLDYLIEAVQSEMFGEPMYPKLSDKAGLYFFNIICNHIFQDGNKRTGLEAAILFIRLNGGRLKENLVRIEAKSKAENPIGDEILFDPASSNGVLYDFVIDTASGKLELEDCQKWFQLNVDLLDFPQLLGQ